MTGPGRFLAALVTAVSATACSSSSAPTTPTPTNPTSIAGPFNGVWQVTGSVTNCGGLRGCWVQIGRSVALTLRLTHYGDVVEGSAVIGDKLFEVQGQATSGELRLTGTQRQGGYCIGDAMLTELVLATAGGAPTGQFRWVSTRPSTCPYYDYQTTQEGRVDSASRVADQTAVASYTGSWSGSATTEACSPQEVVKVCYGDHHKCEEDAERWPMTVVCESGAHRPWAIGLTQSGQAVSGTLISGIPVVGTVQNGRVVVSGTRTWVYASLDPGTHVHSVTDAMFVMDHLGRLSGTYRIDREYIPPSGSPVSRWSQFERLDHVVIR